MTAVTAARISALIDSVTIRRGEEQSGNPQGSICGSFVFLPVVEEETREVVVPRGCNQRQNGRAAAEAPAVELCEEVAAERRIWGWGGGAEVPLIALLPPDGIFSLRLWFELIE